MERVGALINKLKEQYDQNVDKKSLLVTVQLLLAELEQSPAENASKGKVSVMLPKVHRIVQDIPGVEPAPAEEPKSVTIPGSKPVTPPEAEQPREPEREIPETIRSYVLKPPQQPSQPSKIIPQQEPVEQKQPVTPEPAQTPKPIEKKPEQAALFDPVKDVPTLAHHKEVYELNDVHIDGDSLNDKLKEEKTEVRSTIKNDMVHDLRKAIGINDRYRFINELFRGDEDMYERSIKTINGFTSLAEADTWIQRELKVKVGWNDNNETVKDFDQVVKRRFS